MRTTVAIDDTLLERAKERARRDRLTLGQLIERSLQEHLLREVPAVLAELPVLTGAAGGLRAGIDGASNQSLYDAMDADETVR